jgi:hypothetical protein
MAASFARLDSESTARRRAVGTPCDTHADFEDEVADNLAPARGFLLGAACGALLWLVFGVIAWLAW